MTLTITSGTNFGEENDNFPAAWIVERWFLGAVSIKIVSEIFGKKNPQKKVDKVSEAECLQVAVLYYHVYLRIVLCRCWTIYFFVLFFKSFCTRRSPKNSDLKSWGWMTFLKKVMMIRDLHSRREWTASHLRLRILQKKIRNILKQFRDYHLQKRVGNRKKL